MPSVRSLAMTATTAALGLALSAGSVPAGAVTAHVVDPEAATTSVARVIPGTSYAFTSVVAGKPVRWNPCAVIHWRANTRYGPSGGLGVLKAAVGTIASATHTQWVYDGPTSAVPRTSLLGGRSNKARTIVLGWTDNRSSDLLAGQGRYTAGMTRTLWFSSTTSRGRFAVTRGAVVALNRASRLPLRGPVSWQTVATHELGHVMGLAHARTSNEVMAPVLSRRFSTLQAGDRSGLARLGRQVGCVTFPG